MAYETYGNVIAVKKGGKIAVGIAWGNPSTPQVMVYSYERYQLDTSLNSPKSIIEAVQKATHSWAAEMEQAGVTDSILFVSANLGKLFGQTHDNCHSTTVIYNTIPADGIAADGSNPNRTGPHHARARKAYIAAMQQLNTKSGEAAENSKVIVITSGATREYLTHDAVITADKPNMTGLTIANTMLQIDCISRKIAKIYYLAPEDDPGPRMPDDCCCEFIRVNITTSYDLLAKLEKIHIDEPRIDMIIHACAVVSHSPLYAARMDDMAASICNIADKIDKSAVIEALANPLIEIDKKSRLRDQKESLVTIIAPVPNITDYIMDWIASTMPETIFIDGQIVPNAGQGAQLHDIAGIMDDIHADYMIADTNDSTVIVRRDPETNEPIFATVTETIRNMFENWPVKHTNKRSSIYWHVLAGDNVCDKTRLAGFAADEPAAWDIMASEFANLAKAKFGVDITPDKIAHHQNVEYNDMNDGKQRAARLTETSAYIVNGANLYYWNLIPANCSYAQEEQNLTGRQNNPEKEV